MGGAAGDIRNQLHRGRLCQELRVAVRVHRRLLPRCFRGREWIGDGDVGRVQGSLR